MPHQCVHCGKLYPDASPQLLTGCDKCRSKFFFFIRKEQVENLKKEKESNAILNLQPEEKREIEKDVRDMIGIRQEQPVILDFESVRVIKPGKFEIDIVNLFRKDRPLIYKLEEGKYIIDLAATLKVSLGDIKEKIKNSDKKRI